MHLLFTGEDSKKVIFRDFRENHRKRFAGIALKITLPVNIE